MKIHEFIQFKQMKHNEPALSELILNSLIESEWPNQPLVLNAGQRLDIRQLLLSWVSSVSLKNDQDMAKLIRARKNLRMLIEAAGFDYSIFLAQALNISVNSSWSEISVEARHKIALLADPRFAVSLKLVDWSQHEPLMAMVFAILALDSAALRKDVLDGLKQIAQSLPDMLLADMPMIMINSLQAACLRLSYFDSPDRYKAHRRLLEQTRHILAGHGLLAEHHSSQTHQRPRLMVVGEGMNDNHAMFRFFANPIHAMRQYFHVSLLADITEKHVSVSNMVDEVIPLKKSANPVSAWAQQIIEHAPDVIFYPGIGASLPTFILSLLRLSPLQVASIGLPLSDYPAEIDAILMFNGLSLPPQMPTALWYNQHSVGNINSDLTIKPRHRASTTVPTIAINAMAVKLNDDFLSTIQFILEQYNKPYHLIFMPNLGSGLLLQELMQHLMNRFPGAEVFSSLTHQQYMHVLANCDLVLQSFPFGGANTTNDALDLGIPVVALSSPWLSGQTDSLMLADRGMAELCVDNKNAYIELALELLNNPSTRGKISQSLLNTGAGAGKKPQGQEDMGKALFDLWHQKVKNMENILD